jgi:hypothetical protein
VVQKVQQRQERQQLRQVEIPGIIQEMPMLLVIMQDHLPRVQHAQQRVRQEQRQLLLEPRPHLHPEQQHLLVAIQGIIQGITMLLVIMRDPLR